MQSYDCDSHAQLATSATFSTASKRLLLHEVNTQFINACLVTSNARTHLRHLWQATVPSSLGLLLQQPAAPEVLKLKLQRL
jgi:hypothetical protein